MFQEGEEETSEVRSVGGVRVPLQEESDMIIDCGLNSFRDHIHKLINIIILC